MLSVSRRLGHESIKTTGDVYGHLDRTSDERIAAAIAQARRRTPAG